MIAEPTRSRWHDQIRALAVGSTALHAACADGRAAHWIASAVRARHASLGAPHCRAEGAAKEPRRQCVSPRLFELPQDL